MTLVKRLGVPFPSGLTKLSVRTLHSSDIEMLPSGLKSLDFDAHSLRAIRNYRLARKSNDRDAFLATKFIQKYLLTTRTLLQLPPLLTDLSLYMAHVWRYDNLKALKRLSSLQKLTLSGIFEDMLSMGFTAAQCFPNSLQSLTLTMSSGRELDGDETLAANTIPPTWLAHFFRPQENEEILPNLLKLDLSMDIIDEDKLLGSVFPMFPKNLTSLDIRFIPPPVTDPEDVIILSSLPTSLRSLSIGLPNVIDSLKDWIWTDAHFANQLPSLLGHFDVKLTQNCAVTPDVIDFLPNTLFDVRFLGANPPRLLTQAAEARGRQSPQLTYYDTTNEDMNPIMSH